MSNEIEKTTAKNDLLLEKPIVLTPDQIAAVAAGAAAVVALKSVEGRDGTTCGHRPNPPI